MKVPDCIECLYFYGKLIIKLQKSIKFLLYQYFFVVAGAFVCRRFIIPINKLLEITLLFFSLYTLSIPWPSRGPVTKFKFCKFSTDPSFPDINPNRLLQVV